MKARERKYICACALLAIILAFTNLALIGLSSRGPKVDRVEWRYGVPTPIELQRYLNKNYLLPMAKPPLYLDGVVKDKTYKAWTDYIDTMWYEQDVEKIEKLGDNDG